MHLRDRTKRRDLGWFQRKARVSILCSFFNVAQKFITKRETVSVIIPLSYIGLHSDQRWICMCLSVHVCGWLVPEMNWWSSRAAARFNKSEGLTVYIWSLFLIHWLPGGFWTHFVSFCFSLFFILFILKLLPIMPVSFLHTNLLRSDKKLESGKSKFAIVYFSFFLLLLSSLSSLWLLITWPV